MKIPSSEAAAVAAKYAHEVVVIVAYDGLTLEVASFGVRAVSKDVAADWADRIPSALDFDSESRTINEDYRATTAAQYKRKIDVLRNKIKVADKILKEMSHHVPTITTLGERRVADVEEVFKLKRMAADAWKALAEEA